MKRDKTDFLALVSGAVLLLLSSCGDPAETGGGAEMTSKGEPLWKRMYDEQQRFKRERVVELAKTSPTYSRPERDPAIKMTDYDGKIAYLDENTGDILVMHSAESERKLIDYAFRTAAGELVAFYKVQIVSGYPNHIEYVPYRMYAITYNQNPSPDAAEARARVSPERFAEFLASNRDYVEDPDRRFLVIYAPLEAGERLL